MVAMKRRRAPQTQARTSIQELDAPEDEGARTVSPGVREGEADATVH